MAKRISQLAKELGVKTAAVIEKCLAEGVPQASVKGPSSTVSERYRSTKPSRRSSRSTAATVPMIRSSVGGKNPTIASWRSEASSWVEPNACVNEPISAL